LRLRGESRASLGASAWAGIAASSESHRGAEPLISRRRPCPPVLVPESGAAGSCGVERLARAQGLIAEQERPVCPASSAQTARISRWRKRAERIRAKVKARTGRNRVGIGDVRELIAELNPILRGGGNYFRTGNAADTFDEIDRYVAWRLKRLLVKREGRNLRAGDAAQWTADWLRSQGLYRLGGTIRYPRAA